VEAIVKKVNQQLPEPLSTRVVRGGLWVFALRSISRVLRLIRTIILARLLAPEDFGLFGIALLSLSTLEAFSRAGFQVALIQKRDNVESYLDTAWTVSAIRGTILFLILFFAAPLIAKFFDSPKASLVIRVIALYTLFSGFRNIGILFFQKELEFNKEFFYELSATLADLTVAISLAFILRNVWALVYGGLAGNFVRLFMSYLLHPYRPRIKFEKEKFQDLFDFGKWLLGGGILVFLITQGDDIFVGKMLGVTALGFYQMAYLISNLPATEISHVMSHVTFPAYSILQQDVVALRNAYLKVLQLTTFLSIPFAGLILVLAPQLTKVFLGAKWMPMTPALQALACWGIIRSIGATMGPVFQAIGKPQILTKMLLLAVILLALLIYPLSIKWGILGTSIAVVVAIFISTLLAAHMLIKVLNCKIYQFYVRVFFPLLSFLLPFLLFFIINRLYIIKYNLLTLSFIICMMIITYMGILYLLDKYSNYGITSTIKELIINIKS
jgi:O-antigen/teichoic acid export membrane protein